LNADYTFSTDPWPAYSEEVKDLITRMLVLKPELRIPLHIAIDHDWFSSATHAPKLEEKVDEIIPVLRKLNKYTVPKKFKQMATQIALNHLTADHYKDL
jgi:serine/threonine protein kinase